MTDRSVVHSTFHIERRYDASPAKVFAAWATKEAKAAWFGAATDQNAKYAFDFRVGGREHSEGAAPNGISFVYDAVYQDIVPDRRIIYSYDMLMGDHRISVSLGTVDIVPNGKGSKLTYTEQGVYLDGLDNPTLREAGTHQLLDALGKFLGEQTKVRGRL